ncbi:MAG TPA: TetR/AcrR family transcriptional regulator [Actinomycetota bacterium]|jgi:AcrR family transcriptional regulator
MQVEQQPATTREQIVAAADHVVHERGLAAATTKAIAERAGCAEGSIYRYFPDKHALLIETIRTRFPSFIDVVASLPERAGKATVRKNLELVATTAIGFYRGVLPITAGCLSERKLLEEQRRMFQKTNTGPARALGAVTAYLRREQRIGRISDRVSPEHLSRTLLGTCFLQAFSELVAGDDAAMGSDEQFARETVRTLMEGAAVRTRG